MLRLDVISFSISMSLLIFILFYCFQQQQKIGGEDAIFFFFLIVAFQILYVFLSDISVHCALIEYAYI
jgi:hypothetical protein